MKQLVFLAVFLIAPFAAWANKVALVIGNSKYVSVAELDNPDNDARAISRALALQGFDVIAANDLTRNAMRDTLRDFRVMADQADVALVYYAGHGIEIAGANYLVPVDARLEDERDAELEMVELDLVLSQISGAKALKMVVLDACRNNPFIVKMKRSESGRSVNSGLGRIEFAAADTLIAYAAAAGEITPDGTKGSNSPFTQAFLAALEGPPTDVRRLLGRVRDNMREAVPGAAPFVYTSLGGGEFVINPNGRAPEPVVVAPVSPAPSISADFVRIDRSGTFEDWDEFLIRHEAESDNPLYAFALEKREALRKKSEPAPQPAATQVVASVPAVVPAPVPAPAPAPFAQAVAPTTPLVSAGPQPAGDDTRTASLGVDESTAEAQRSRIVEAPLPSDTEMALQLQTLLRDAKCYNGAIDGLLGPGSRSALSRFATAANESLPSDATKGGVALRDTILRVSERSEVECPPMTVRAQPVAKPRAKQPVAAAPVVKPATQPQPPAPSRMPKTIGTRNGFGGKIIPD